MAIPFAYWFRRAATHRRAASPSALFRAALNGRNRPAVVFVPVHARRFARGAAHRFGPKALAFCAQRSRHAAYRSWFFRRRDVPVTAHRLGNSPRSFRGAPSTRAFQTPSLPAWRFATALMAVAKVFVVRILRPSRSTTQVVYRAQQPLREVFLHLDGPQPWTASTAQRRPVVLQMLGRSSQRCAASALFTCTALGPCIWNQLPPRFAFSMASSRSAKPGGASFTQASASR